MTGPLTITSSVRRVTNCVNVLTQSLNTLVDEIGGLSVENLVVPEVILSPAVQDALDAIVQSRLETEKAAQDELRADAEAAAEQARQEGEIRVEQSRLQEQTRQQTLLAELEQQRAWQPSLSLSRRSAPTIWLYWSLSGS